MSLPTKGGCFLATIHDVAKMAGVSASSVSIYLNNKKRLKPETSRRIAEAINSLCYVVQNSGRELRTKTNNDIGIIFPNMSEPYYEKVISSIKGYLLQNGKNVILEFSDDNPHIETRILHNFIGRKTSGIILYSCQPNNTEVFKSLEASQIHMC